MPTRLIKLIILAFTLVAFPGNPICGDQPAPVDSDEQEILDGLPGARHGYADSAGVRIHYVTMGKGPLVVLIHGFPDFWFTWRKQMPALAKNYHVVAIDQRGYNRSGKPAGVDNYRMPILVADVAAVIQHFGQKKATIVGHDWGGAVAWSFAMSRPEMTQRLVILNLPHPNGLQRELANNPDQQKNSQYARDFQQPDAAKKLTAKGLAAWVKEPEARKWYVEAFERSSFDAMLNYYKANYPRSSTKSGTKSTSAPMLPKVKCPVLMFHGLDDKALLASGLNNTWDWVEKDLTIITIPGAGHFVQQDASDLVTRRLKSWLDD